MRSAVLVAAVVFVSFFVSGQSARGVTVFVVNTADDSDDFTCSVAANGCTLREAINAANSLAGPDEIRFNIPGGGVRQISVLSALPAVTDQVSILGLTQSTASCSPARNIRLEIVNGGGLTDGLTIQDSNSVVSGISVNGFDRNIVLGGGGGHTVGCSNIGVDATGTLTDASSPALAIETADVTVGGAAAQANLIGGSTAISLEAVTGTEISHNRIGRQVADLDYQQPGDDAIRIVGAASNTEISNNEFGTFSAGVVANAQSAGLSSLEIIGNTFTPAIRTAITISAHEGGSVLINDCVFDGPLPFTTSIQLDGDHSLTEIYANTFNRPRTGIALGIDGGITIGGDEPGQANTFNGAATAIVIQPTPNRIPGELLIQGNIFTKGPLPIVNEARIGILFYADHTEDIPVLDATVSGNSITGMNSAGIAVQGIGGVTITQNFIGVTELGEAGPNGYGIQVALNGDSAPVTITSNVISANFAGGLVLLESTGVALTSNKIGPGPGDEQYFTQPLGVLISGGSGHTLNGGNTIRYNIGPGISVVDSDSFLITENSIVNNGGAGLVAVSTGEALTGTARNNVLVENGGPGISIVGPYTVQADINTYANNAGLSIDLGGDGPTANDALDPDSGPNGLLNAPEITWVQRANGALTIHATLHTSAFTDGYLVFVSSPTCRPDGYGQGSYLTESGFFQTDADGNAVVVTVKPIAISPGTYVSAVFRNGTSIGLGTSSEFSRCVLVVSESAPTLNQLDATSAKRGGDGFTMTLRGANFAADAVGQWKGSPRQTTVLSAEEMTIEVTAEDLEDVGTVNITVQNPPDAPLLAEQSNPLPFAVRVGSAADVNCSGYVDGVDALDILRALAGLGESICPADANLSNSVDLLDARYVRLVAASLLPE